MITIEIHQAMFRAARRCHNLAMSERLQGYCQSAQTYEDMAVEFTHAVPWLYGYMAHRQTAMMERDGILVRG